MVKIIKYIFLTFSFLVGITIILLLFINYLPPDFSKGFLIDREWYFFKGYFIFFYAHIVGGLLALFTGCILFAYSFQFKFPKFHRSLGKIYCIGVLLLCSIGGFAMSFFSIGGIFSTIGFLVLSLLWFYTTWKAFIYARNKNFEHHKKWMTRSFLLTLAAPILRLELFLNFQFNWFETTTFYILTAWISWMPQLLVFEFLNWRRKI